MAARELSRNYTTRYCLFYIDSYDSDAKNLPTSKESGKEDLSLSSPCAFGSVAKDALGKRFVLDGNDNWVLSASSSGSGSGSTEIPDSEIATEEEVNDMIDEIFGDA